MELRQLKYFVKIAETLNFSEAAKALCVTQSTLSQQIKQLEEEIGEQLLIRTSHSVALSEAGGAILKMLSRLFMRRGFAWRGLMTSTAWPLVRLTLG